MSLLNPFIMLRVLREPHVDSYKTVLKCFYICNTHSKGYQSVCMHSVLWNTSYNCMFELDSLVHCLCGNLVQGSHSCLHIHSLLDQHSHFVDNESVHRLYIDTLVYVNVNRNW